MSVAWIKAMRSRGWLWLTVGVLLLALSGCATGPKLTNHSFSFNILVDNPDAELLDYRYGESRQPGARASNSDLKYGRVLQGGGIHGPMLLGDYLYAKWRIKSTGQSYEDTVDLQRRLPSRVEDHTLYFVVDAAQLYVFLISDKQRVEGRCPAVVKPGAEHRAFVAALSPPERVKYKYCYLQVITLYPDQPAK